MTGWADKLSGLIWPLTLCASLSAHGAAALWLTRTEEVQREGDETVAAPMTVAFVPAPAPAPPPLAEPPAPLPMDAPDPPLPDIPLPDVPASVTAPQPMPVHAPAEPPAPKVEPAPAPSLAPAPKPKPVKEPEPEPRKSAEKTKPKSEPAKSEPAKKDPAPKTKAPEPAAAEPSAPAAKPAKAASAAGTKKWAAKIRSRIERKKRYPEAAQGASGSVTVSIKVAGSGALSGVSVIGSSGNAALDAAALKAVKSAAPFPAAPAGQAGAEFKLTMVFAR